MSLIQPLFNYRVYRARREFLTTPNDISKSALRTEIQLRRDQYLEVHSLKMAGRVVDFGTSITYVDGTRAAALNAMRTELYLSDLTNPLKQSSTSKQITHSHSRFSGVLDLISKDTRSTVMLGIGVASYFFEQVLLGPKNAAVPGIMRHSSLLANAHHAFRHSMPIWALGNVPDILEAMVLGLVAGTFAMVTQVVYELNPNSLSKIHRYEVRANLAASGFAMLGGIGTEIGQGLHWVRGTFDPLDIVAFIIGGSLAFQINKLWYTRKVDMPKDEILEST